MTVSEEIRASLSDLNRRIRVGEIPIETAMIGLMFIGGIVGLVIIGLIGCGYVAITDLLH